MSAIAGLLGLHRATLEAEPAERMAAALAARGPHDDGSYRSPDGRAVLAVRRLATIDARGGAQPLANETHDVWLVLDGEVLNHRALRHSLELVGHRFRTNSDAEVAVHAYEQWGLDFLPHLQGAFALALWDDRRDRLVLARDRLGRKPLYIAERRGRLGFASGVRPLLDGMDLPRGLDATALGQYLALGYVPAPRTLACGVHKLAAGEMLVAERGERPKRRRWGVPEPEPQRAAGIRTLPAERHLGNLRTLLECSVADRLVSDHAAGIMLEPGAAACAVASIVARFTGRSEPVVTVIDGHASDGAAAREMRLLAQWARGDLEEVPVTSAEFAEALPAIAAAMPEPSAEAGLVASWFAGRAAARLRLRAVQGACGAEEVLLCHPDFDAARPGGRLARLSAWLRRAAHPLPTPLGTDWAEALGPAALGKIPAPQDLDSTMPGWMAGDGLAWYGLRDLKGRLSDSVAPGLDAMLGAHGVEARLPFLDEPLLAYALAVPGSARAPSGSPRHTLRRLLGDLAPAAAIAHPPPPALPVESWLAGPLRSMADALAARSPLVRDGVLSADLLAIRAQRPWAAVALLAWSEAAGIEGLAAEGDQMPALAHSRS